MVDVFLVRLNGAGLVSGPGVVLHEALAQIPHCGGVSGCGLSSAWVVAAPDVRQPILRDPSSLLDRQFTEASNSWLAPITGVRTILNHEDFSTRWGHLQHEAGHNGIAELIVFLLWEGSVRAVLGQLDLWHLTLRVGSQGPPRGHRVAGSGVDLAAIGWAGSNRMLGKSCGYRALSRSRIEIGYGMVSRLKVPRPQGCAGSTPAVRTSRRAAIGRRNRPDA